MNTHRCPPPPEETPPAATTNLDIADAAIQRLFRAGLNLAACAGVVKGVAADRVAAAITDLDTVIVELRAAAFAQPPHSADPTVGPAPGQAPAATHSVIQQLAVLARGVGELAEPADGPAVIHHYDAGHSLCRALVALAADPMSGTPPGSPDVGGVRPRRQASEHQGTRSSSQYKGAAVATKRATKPPTVAVTLTLPAAVDANEVALCGEFNGWSRDDLKLARKADGSWEASLRLAPGAYRYRYLLDGTRWENAWDADDYVANPYGGDDSVIVVAG